MPSTIGNVFRVITKMKQGIEGGIRYDPNIPTTTAIAARRPTARHKLLPAKSCYAIASVAALNMNLDPINKHLNRKRRRR
jgi:hypothetical protein